MTVMNRTLLATLLIAVSPTVAAEQYLLDDGTTFVASPIGEAHGVLTLLRADGEKITVERARIVAVDRSVAAPEDVAANAAKQRKKFLAQRRKEADKLLAKLGRAKEADRPEIRSELDDYGEKELLPVLTRGLLSKKQIVRDESLARLRAGKRPESIVALSVGAIAAPEGTAKLAHAAATDKDIDLALLFYEYVAAYPTEVPLRVNAIERIADVGRVGSGRTLIGVMELVRLEAGYTHAEIRGARQRPLTLGNTQLTVELPIVEVLRVKTAVTAPSLRVVNAAAVQALQRISGYEYGDDLKTWQRWWKRLEKEREESGGAIDD